MEAVLITALFHPSYFVPEAMGERKAFVSCAGDQQSSLRVNLSMSHREHFSHSHPGYKLLQPLCVRVCVCFLHPGHILPQNRDYFIAFRIFYSFYSLFSTKTRHISSQNLIIVMKKVPFSLPVLLLFYIPIGDSH